MYKCIILITCLLLIEVSVQAQSVHSTKLYREIDGQYYLMDSERKVSVNNKVLTVRLKKGKKLANLHSLLRKNKLGYIDIKVPDGISVDDYATELNNSGEFELVKYNTYGVICVNPNDDYVWKQWYLNCIRAFEAWNLTLGDSAVKVAVIDAITYNNHSDFDFGTDGYRNVLWTLGNDYTGIPSNSYHGLSVAGVIGTKTNNSIGIAGLGGGYNDYGVGIIPYNVSSGGFNIDMSVVDDAIIDATDKGAKVINMSFGSNLSAYEDIDDAIEYASSHGVILTAASGNDGQNNWIRYPASHPQVIAVGAVGKSLFRSSYSNAGVGLDLVAPGDSIYVITNGSSYGYQSGTSFAAPLVSGTVALMLSANPYLTESQVRDALKNTCRKLPAYSYNANGWNNETGYGLVNAYAAVSAVIPKVQGSDCIYNNARVYSVSYTPDSLSVTWSLSGSNASCFTLESNTPSTNQCRITRRSDAVFYDDAHLTLMAQISHNGTMVRTVSKELTVPFIDGPEVPCGMVYYFVNGIQNNETVEWVASGTGLDFYTDPLGRIPPEPMAYVINNDGTGTLNGTLTATIKRDGTVVGTLSRKIDESGNFHGMWYQEPTATDTLNSCPKTFHNRQWLSIVPNRKVYLQSDYFATADITYTADEFIVFDWDNSNGIISFTPILLAAGSPWAGVNIQGTYPGSCQNFTLRVYQERQLEPLNPLHLSIVSGDVCEFSLAEEEQSTISSEGMERWQLTIVNNVGSNVYHTTVSDSKVQVNTSGWKPGIYVAFVRIGDQYYSKKFSVGE